jgi:AAA15 family ATPase/GTPase
MEDYISSVSIKNFKSIKDLSFDCKKINIFIGKPNVGKSNILEAMSLFALPMAMNLDLSKFVRIRTMDNLFTENNTKYPIEVKIFSNKANDNISAFLSAHSNGYELNIGRNVNNLKRLYYNSNGSLQSQNHNDYQSEILNYKFEKGIDYTQSFHNYLLPPNGPNLVSIVQGNRQLFNEVQDFFEENGFELLILVGKNEFVIQKRIEKGVYQFPFELMADTLQRIIFYLAAIESNHGASIIFEEPETHSFPPYIRIIAKRICMDESNQYFISTHSPYLLNTIIEETDIEDINVFVTYFEDYQTKVKALSKDELRGILDDSIDAFFNLDRFTPVLK